MKRLLVISVLLAAACSLPPPTSSIDPSIEEAVSRAEKQKPPPAPGLEQQLLPPLRMEMPKVGGELIDQRFDLSVANAPASQVFNSLVAIDETGVKLKRGEAIETLRLYPGIERQAIEAAADKKESR